MLIRKLGRMLLVALTLAATTLTVVAGSSPAPAYAADPTGVEYPKGR